MTLLLGAANNSVALIASDRRLSWDGEVVDDEANKATILVTRDARVALVFTGLARWQGFSTERWLLEVLCDAAKQTAEILPMLDYLESRANTDLKCLSGLEPERARLGIMVVGFTYGPDGPSPAGWLLSNLKSDVDGTDFSRFTLNAGDPENPVLVRLAGTTAGVPSTSTTQLGTLLASHIPVAGLEGKVAHMIRVASAAPKSGGVVGPQGNVCVIPADTNMEMRSTYYSAAASRVVYGANSIIATSGTGAFMMGGSVMSVGHALPPANVPKVHDHAPCPCGSGLRYEQCHLGWKYQYLPMSMEQEMTGDHPGFPSGRRFVLRCRGTASEVG